MTPAQNAPERILIVAEKLFAVHGFHGVTLRQLTSAAEVNLAAVNYHHTDKESLFRTILSRRLAQLSAERLRLLNAAEARATGEPMPLQEIADCLAAPLLQPVESMTGFGPHSRRLIGRSLVEPLPFLADILAANFHPTVARCGQAFRRHLPSLPPADFLWHYSFVVGALHHTAATLHDMNALTRGICTDEDSSVALRNFRVWAAETFRALSRT
jgi:AcrR family transcriptional regulator